MSLLDRYETNPFLQRVSSTVEDILVGEGGTRNLPGPLPYKRPFDVHPIARFFSTQSKRNAAGIRYVRSDGLYLLKDIQRINFGSHSHTRPPNPDYFFVKDIAYPVGSIDGNGAGMTFAWTPLAYLLYHDRYNNSDCWYYEIVQGFSSPLNTDIWTRFIQAGHLFKQPNGTDVNFAVRVMVQTDPPADLMPELMFGKDVYRDTPDDAFALVDAATDFQHRWNCGEWFDSGNRHATRDALNTLLGV